MIYRLIIAVTILGWAIALLGCGSTPYLTPPQIEQVQLRVQWSTLAEIRIRCGEKAIGCATTGSVERPQATMWVERPEGFDDFDRVCTMGEELLHALGAMHDDLSLQAARK